MWLSGPFVFNFVYHQYLDLSNNDLSVLPSEFGTLTVLKTLILDNNELRGIRLWNLACFCSLAFCALELPEFLSHCSLLTTLTANGNILLQRIDSRIFSHCSLLQRVELCDTKVSILPGIDELHIDPLNNPMDLNGFEWYTSTWHLLRFSEHLWIGRFAHTFVGRWFDGISTSHCLSSR